MSAGTSGTKISSFENNGFENDSKDHIRIPLERQTSFNAITYSWSNINVFAKPERGIFKSRHNKDVGEKHILKDVTGICRPGELLAIMGASGAGKTTLLNVLTSREGENLRVDGDLYVNGTRMSRTGLTSQSAYVQQEDLFIGTMTVKEQLMFQAMLRMNRNIPTDKRMERVEEVMHDFSLTKCQDTMIGVQGRIKGISGGETKRLAFACEVLTDPPLMFCDEPTSGLDSFMAQTLVSEMKLLADRGKTIISTIHQPSSEVFALFNRVLLLAEGRVAFLGLTSDALKFFEGLGRRCPNDYNPSDFFISSLAIQPEIEEECQQMVEETCDAFVSSEWGIEVRENAQANMGIDLDEKQRQKRKKSPYKARWMVQFAALFRRGLIEMAREPMLLRIKVIQTIMIALLIGVIYLDVGNDYNQSSVTNINGALFLLLVNLSFQFTFGVVNVFCAQLPIFMREHLNGMYRTDTFYLTKNFSELPTSIFLPMLFLAIIYFMINLTRSVGVFFTIVGVLILVSNVALSFGYLISCLASNLNMALALTAPMLIPFMLFGGFFLNSDSVPVYFIWLQYISWFNYGNEALMIAQWRTVEHINCDDLASPICYRNGQQVLEALGYDEDHLWFDIIALFTLLILFRLIGFLALLRRTYNRF